MSKSEDTNYYISWLENSIEKGHFTYYDYKEFNIKRQIGKGSFGSVACVTWKNAENIFALKSFNIERITLKEVVNEVLIVFKLN